MHWMKERSLSIRVLIYAAVVILALALAVGMGALGALILQGDVARLLEREEPRPADEQPPRLPSGEVIVAAGDIADCTGEGDEATAKLVGDIDGATVLTLGDNAYPDGAAQDFEECYEPSWGQFKERTRPTLGNHEYETEGAAAYFDYFGEAAGDPDEGYYSYDLGAWHIVALNSNCGEAEIRCGPGSAQTEWLKEDLAANSDEGQCTLAYMHHPRFSSGE